jgi:hypothetical protein
MRRLSRISLVPTARSYAESSKRPAQELLSRPGRPVFASVTSSDLRPRVAAQEAFDVAVAAMPKPPNFCIVNVSLDHSDMGEAPGVIWAGLQAVAQKELGGKKPVMLAQFVRQQRFGGTNFLEIVAGHIPDLSADVFTFDNIPQAVSDDAFVGIGLIDWKLSLEHYAEVHSRLAAISQAVPAPVVGGVLPPASPAGATLTADQPESVFCMNDNMFRGSAAVMVLKSPAMQKAAVLTQRPAAVLLAEAIVEGEVVENGGLWTVRTIAGKRATDVVKAVYETQLQSWDYCKVFAAVHLSDGSVLPTGFKGDPETGTIAVTIPPILSSTLADFTKISLVCDAPEHDKEAVAAELIDFQASRNRPSVRERITIARECNRLVTVSDAAMLHWSTPTHYDIMEAPSHGIALTPDGVPTSELHAPSVSSRCIGEMLPCGGIHCGGQVLPLVSTGTATGLDRISGLFARSSAHVGLLPK